MNSLESRIMQIENQITKRDAKNGDEAISAEMLKQMEDDTFWEYLGKPENKRARELWHDDFLLFAEEAAEEYQKRTGK